MEANMTNCFSTRILGGPLATAALTLIASLSFAGVPGTRSIPQSQSPKPMSSNLAADGECLGGPSDPAVVPPCSMPYGQSYSEWATQWEVWFLKLTAQPDGIGGDPDCTINQSGDVWFLAGGITTTCNVPAGKALFFPVINAECSNLESPPFFGATAADRLRCAVHFMDGSTHLAVTLDGKSLHGVERYTFSSSDIPFNVTGQNLFGIPCTSGTCSGFSTNDGYYVMLAPLSPGKHTLQFSGTFAPFGGFTLSTSYVLNVQ
jgi:hypothetical protein